MNPVNRRAPAPRRGLKSRRALKWGLAAAVMAAILGFSTPAYADGILYGPSSISQTGNYTYTASYVAPYAYFQWATRNCETATVETCTTTWIQAWGVPVDQFTQTLTVHLVYTCPPGEAAPAKGMGPMRPTPTYTFQVRVIASAFGQPPFTSYQVTNLCGSQPL
jgi:hypothetical protein